MTATVCSVEISRRPEAVFAYATDFAHFPDWQAGVVSVRTVGNDPPALGATAAVGRRIGPWVLSRTEQITEFSPPTTWTVRGAGGPVVAIAHGSIEPVDDGSRSRVTLALDFEGHGVGRLLVPLVVRRQAGRALPGNAERLKEHLERGG
jgi:uncharacterized protein YndB with AHSA1/START domain